MTNNNQSLLSLQQITKKFNEMTVLNNVDLELKPKEMVALVGASGSGKSTILNIAGCIDEATSGEIILNGQSINQLSKQKKTKLRRKEIGFIFQNFQLIESMNVRQNVELPLMLLNYSSKERKKMATEILESLGIDHIANKKTTQISGGQKQRTAIARALVKKPKLIIADEPTASLDKENSNEVFNIMRQLLANLQTGMLMATHDQHAMKQMHRTIYLEKGEIISNPNQVIS